MQRFAGSTVRIGVVAVGLVIVGAGGGVTACGAGDDPPSKVVAYNTKITLVLDRPTNAASLYHGKLRSAAAACTGGRRVVLFERRAGADRELGRTLVPAAGENRGRWGVWVSPDVLTDRVYVVVRARAGDGLLCRAARSDTLLP